MNAAATGLMAELPDVVLAYGVSDEFRYGPCCPAEILRGVDEFQLRARSDL